MKNPWLSVIIPTYNGEEYLKFALDSIAKQADLEIECIIIDDGSNDKTIEIINSYQTQINLTLFQRERQGNWVTNTNYGLKVANGDYACFLHQDDLWLQDRLKVMKKLIFDHPEVNLFLHSSQFIDPENKFLGNWKCPLPSYPKIIDSNKMVEKLLIQNFISIPAPIFKRDIALKVGGLNEKLWYSADWDFWLKIAATGQTIYIDQPFSCFRVHPNSQTVKRSSNIDDFRQQLELVLEQYFPIWKANQKQKKYLLKIAKFSIDVNVTLAGIVHGEKMDLMKLILSFISLGFLGWYQYLHNSRIWDRVYARLKIKLK
jgi:glycosyltransferase involved in cell wall biosynthesis